MNKLIKEKILKLKEVINEEPLIIEFLNVKKAVEENEELINLLRERDFYKNCSPESREREKYLELEAKYNSNPLVLNYHNLEKEVILFLNEIKEYLI
ncbi:MAG TPA: YlbF family regulator [Candidatus Onthovivens sp.]|nr:YlbF family regulator [Candidatus Onthovivens sp.]